MNTEYKNKDLTNNDSNTVLAEAYSDNWTKVKKYVNKNGWCRIDPSLFPNIDKEFNRHKPYWWRPKSLNGFLGFR